MATAWVITVSSNLLVLDEAGKAEVKCDVTNPGPVQDRAVLAIVPEAGASEKWFAVEEPQRLVPPEKTVSYLVRVAPPAGTAPGTYAFQARAYSADTAPEESSALSNRVAFDVPEQEKVDKKLPKWLVPLIAAVVVVVVGTVLFFVLKDEDEVALDAPTTIFPVAGTAFPAGATVPFAWRAVPEAASFRLLVTTRICDPLVFPLPTTAAPATVPPFVTVPGLFSDLVDSGVLVDKLPIIPDLVLIPDFCLQTRTVVDETVEGTEAEAVLTFPLGSNGNATWTVRALDGSGAEGPASAPVSFSVAQ